MSEPAARVLFLCTHNSARSQMAEGLLRSLSGGQVEVFSAGTVATSVRPEAVAAMQELGIDVSAQESKTLDRYLGEPFDDVLGVWRIRIGRDDQATNVLYADEPLEHGTLILQFIGCAPQQELHAVSLGFSLDATHDARPVVVE